MCLQRLGDNTKHSVEWWKIIPTSWFNFIRNQFHSLGALLRRHNEFVPVQSYAKLFHRWNCVNVVSKPIARLVSLELLSQLLTLFTCRVTLRLRTTRCLCTTLWPSGRHQWPLTRCHSLPTDSPTSSTTSFHIHRSVTLLPDDSRPLSLNSTVT